MNHAELIARARQAAVEIASMGLNGWGNTMSDLADAMERLTAGDVEMSEPDCYDAGLLNDYGGGKVEWWWDYIRHELGAAHDFYTEQFAAYGDRRAAAERGRSEEKIELLTDLIRRFCLSTDEGDDKAQGTHYVDKNSTIRAKGSFLELLSQGRAAIRKGTS
jgi:hypothetical protein